MVPCKAILYAKKKAQALMTPSAGTNMPPAAYNCGVSEVALDGAGQAGA
jgi:hypothetical protein